MPRYRVEVDELRRVRRQYVVEASNAETARDLAESGETLEEGDDGRCEVVGREIVPESLAEIPLQTYEVKQYELYTQAYRVQAASEAEAIRDVLNGEGEAVERSLEYVEEAEDFGMPEEEDLDLCEALQSLGISVKRGVIPSIHGIRQVELSPSARRS